MATDLKSELEVFLEGNAVQCNAAIEHTCTGDAHWIGTWCTGEVRFRCDNAYAAFLEKKWAIKNGDLPFLVHNACKNAWGSCCVSRQL